jgi:hypothetical protein
MEFSKELKEDVLKRLQNQLTSVNSELFELTKNFYVNQYKTLLKQQQELQK